ncbi:hypothetical protein Purlil1_12363 [Purpureocillium lilacinum]|uniref:Uncharacterized protein n=1 Tax=Purpureocillium lilacinum TaxID=33203 RepID=A0ABR0BH16_PURLI|nr:hypothetical protein Purlil1_12363 [Purpureocillium lilacinum]
MQCACTLTHYQLANSAPIYLHTCSLPNLTKSQNSPYLLHLQLFVFLVRHDALLPCVVLLTSKLGGESPSVQSPIYGTKPSFHGQHANRPPDRPQFTRPPVHHNPGNILTAFKEATGRSDRLQKQAPPSAPSRPGPASSSRSGSTVQSSLKYTPSPEASAAAPKPLGKDKANETPMLAPGAVKPPLSSLAHKLTARVEQASGALNSSPAKSGFPPANPGVSDQRVASPVAADPMSPSSVASHDSRPVNTPRSDHTENDWDDVNQDKN